ncbi:MAG TPA: hypothetical protein VFU02_13950 [Polyangiaceae bacterium]|nr:hypothetical protein [Polyangiaceae bacterium]
MLELATLAATFLAFALLHAAEPRRRPLRFRSPAPMWRHASRLLSGMLLLFSIAWWARVEGAPAAILVVLTMFSTTATLFVLAVPVVPRLVWGTALACALSLPFLSWLGASGG